MSQETQTQPNTQNQYEVGTSFVFNGEPEAPNVVLAGLGRAVEAVKLETRMFVFDALHNTNALQRLHLPALFSLWSNSQQSSFTSFAPVAVVT
jgi:hypothetical protein